MILKAINDLSTKMNELIAYIKMSSMAVKDRCSDHIGTSSFESPLKTLNTLHTLEVALKEIEFGDQFVSFNRCL